MKKSMVFLSFVVVLFIVAKAEAGILNNPTGFKDFINSLEPGNSYGYDFGDKGSVNVTSVSLFTYENRNLGLGNLRIGYGDPQKAVGILEIITPNLIKRFVPESFRGIKANLSVLTLLPSVGFMTGYDVAEKDFVWGPTAGAKFTF